MFHNGSENYIEAPQSPELLEIDNTSNKLYSDEKILNGDFEDGLAGWIGTAATVSIETANPISGNQSLLITQTSFGGRGQYSFTTIPSGSVVRVQAKILIVDKDHEDNVIRVYIGSDIVYEYNNPTNGQLLIVDVVHILTVDAGVIWIYHSRNAGAIYMADDVSVKEIISDKPMRFLYGEQLLQNRKFSNGSENWTLGTDWSTENNQLKFSYINGGNQDVKQSSAQEIGLFYRISFDCIDADTNNNTVNLLGHSGGVIVLEAGKSYSVVLEAVSTNFYFRCQATEGYLTLDNLSMKREDDTSSTKLYHDDFEYIEKSNNMYFTDAGELNKQNFMCYNKIQVEPKLTNIEKYINKQD